MGATHRTVARLDEAIARREMRDGFEAVNMVVATLSQKLLRVPSLAGHSFSRSRARISSHLAVGTRFYPSHALGTWHRAMPTAALVGALKRTRVSSDSQGVSGSPRSSDSPKPSKPKQSRRAVTFGQKVEHALGFADGEIDRTPHGEPPRCGGCGLHCLGRLYACKTCERRVRLESLEVGPSFQEQIQRAFNLCTVCFSAHVRVSWTSGKLEDEYAKSKSTVKHDVDILLEQIKAVDAERELRGDGIDEEECGATTTLNTHINPKPEKTGKDALAMRHESDEKNEMTESLASPSSSSDVSFGVHEHGPYHFTRRNDLDQEAMDAVLLEKKRFAEERGDSRGAEDDKWVDSGEDEDVELHESFDHGVSEVVVSENLVPMSETETEMKPKTAPKPAWDYASELI